MNVILSIAFGGAIGAVSRYMLSSAIQNISGNSFPYGMLLCNILGSMILGILYDSLSKGSLFSDNIKLFIQVGILGSFTTFSAFSFETIDLLTNNKLLLSLMYIILSLVLCLIAAYVGLNINKFLNW